MTEPRPTILYVDDEEPNMLLFRLTFKHELTVLTARSGEEALKVLGEHSEIVAVFSDYSMPVMTGLEFIAKARKLHHAKYFLLTGFETTVEIESARKKGLIDGSLMKPFTKDDVLNALKE